MHMGGLNINRVYTFEAVPKATPLFEVSICSCKCKIPALRNLEQLITQFKFLGITHFEEPFKVVLTTVKCYRDPGRHL